MSKLHEEHQYLDLIRLILKSGTFRQDRTGTGTISIFAPNPLRFSLENFQFPLLTTKKTFFRGVAEELLWFIKGDTNSKHLSEKGVKIWDGNGSRSYLDSIGLNDRMEGDLGPVYGFQWRHFGAEYLNCNADYSGKGVDQLAQVVEALKNHPFSRRIILSAWNPADILKMALPPCHVLSQFYVSNEKELSCLLYQRSADIGLGVPFNIASYALLTRMLAQVSGLKAKELIHMIGDAHIYSDHVEQLKILIEREPFPFPTLRIREGISDIDSFNISDFEIIDYKSHDKIQMSMSV